MLRIRIALVAAASALALCVLPALAEANFVYWTNQNGTSIGRAKLNGEGVNDNFITGLNLPQGIATDSKYIYWMQGDSTDATIARANLDGSGVNLNFIPHQAGMNAGGGISITPANGIYWANRMNTIGHANLDGSNAQANFIITGGAVINCGLATDGSFVYWANTSAGIGRATLAGGGINSAFVTGTAINCGLAIDKDYMYFGATLQRIGRAPIGGGTANNDFIANATIGSNPCGMGITPEYLFWGNATETAIGRANTNGTGVNKTLIDGPSNPCLVFAAPPNKVTVNALKRNKKKGTARIDAKVPGPGQVDLTTEPLGASEAGTVKKTGLTLTSGGSFSLPVKPQGKAAKRLKKKGKAKVTVYINFTPAGTAGVTNSQKQVVKLAKKLKKKKKKK